MGVTESSGVTLVGGLNPVGSTTHTAPAADERVRLPVVPDAQPPFALAGLSGPTSPQPLVF
jgi:hypothetical protein